MKLLLCGYVLVRCNAYGISLLQLQTLFYIMNHRVLLITTTLSSVGFLQLSTLLVCEVLS